MYCEECLKKLTPPTPEQLAELKEGDEVLVKGKIDTISNDKKTALIINDDLFMGWFYVINIVTILPKKEKCLHSRMVAKSPSMYKCEDCGAYTELAPAKDIDQPKEMPKTPYKKNHTVSVHDINWSSENRLDINQLIDCVRDLQERIRNIEAIELIAINGNISRAFDRIVELEKRGKK